VKRPALGRLATLLAFFAVCLGGIVVRLADLQVGEHERLTTLGREQRVRTMALPARRGGILDRTGQPLAMSVEARDIYADRNYVLDPEATAERIGEITGQRPAEIRRPLVRGETPFVFLARQVTPVAARRILALGLPGVGVLPTSARSYPADSLAPQVLGFVDIDGLGIAGLELEYQDTLAGAPGERVQEMDPGGRPIVSGVSTERPPIPGDDVVTTIDRPLQYMVQAALEAAVERNRASGGTVIVMDPRTGAVHAMATFPWFDPNEFASAPREAFRNRAVTDTFEPGSVNKVITAAAAIEERALPLEERLVVPDRVTVGDAVIHDSHPHPIERMTLGDVIAKSSNVGITQVADRLGSGGLATYLTRFGFGRPTGVDFPGEAAGTLLPLTDWSQTSRATMAFGQGISATPLQMASVYATVANGGEWVAPRLASGTVDVGGRYRPFPGAPTRQVVSTNTAEMLTRMLAYAVEDGTGTAARIEGYQVAGKTGTARKPYVDRAGYARRYVASFMGFLPASEPQVVVVAILDEPATIYGGVAAAPLFQEVARFAIQRLSISPGRRVHLPPHALEAT
jgi:cell division protein FtsI (penicillin-binding protein 3)